jgi:hypothetical protein
MEIYNGINTLTTNQKIEILRTIECNEEIITCLRDMSKKFSQKKKKDYMKNYYKKKYSEDDFFKEKIKERQRQQYNKVKEKQTILQEDTIKVEI